MVIFCGFVHSIIFLFDESELIFFSRQNVEIGVLLGGVKCSYAFDLLLETKDEHKQFPVYEIGGLVVSF